MLTPDQVIARRATDHDVVIGVPAKQRLSIPLASESSAQDEQVTRWQKSRANLHR